MRGEFSREPGRSNDGEIGGKVTVANAADALDKARFESISRPELAREWEIRIAADKDANTLTFIDNGIPYDPLAKPDPDVTLPVVERSIGGLGIYMAKKSMDSVFYEYKDGQNVLRMEKHL